jgi:type II restriction enzyme
MANSENLRRLRRNTIINLTSKQQEKEIVRALIEVERRLDEKFHVALHFSGNWYLKDIVGSLRNVFPSIEFFYHFDTSSVRPDGGVLFLVSKSGDRYPILISEVKNQGTNERRLKEGLKKQAKGNAIERLGKNVIGLKTALLSETIFPFVCFGYGCDFAADSSILDRVSTLAMFGPLNTTNLHASGPNGEFQRGSFYFREAKWGESEMIEIMYDIASRSVQYYFSKYGEQLFV